MCAISLVHGRDRLAFNKDTRASSLPRPPHRSVTIGRLLLATVIVLLWDKSPTNPTLGSRFLSPAVAVPSLVSSTDHSLALDRADRLSGLAACPRTRPTVTSSNGARTAIPMQIQSYPLSMVFPPSFMNQKDSTGGAC